MVLCLIDPRPLVDPDGALSTHPAARLHLAISTCRQATNRPHNRLMEEYTRRLGRRSFLKSCPLESCCEPAACGSNRSTQLTVVPSLSTVGAWSGSRKKNPLSLPCTDITRLLVTRLALFQETCGRQRYYAVVQVSKRHLSSSLIPLLEHT